MLSVSDHRRFTANHTWRIDGSGRSWFVKINPNRSEADAEVAGHTRIRGFYPVPRLFWTARLGRWTFLVYEHRLNIDQGDQLLLDEITRTDQSRDSGQLDKCLAAVVSHYRHVIYRTLCRVSTEATVGKLYGDRIAPRGRLDLYYGRDRPWQLPGRIAVRPSELARHHVVVNGREYRLDFSRIVTWLRTHFSTKNAVWAAITQGDPTDLNIGWSGTDGPVWFDYDTGGYNAVAGEFACFLFYQRLHGAWFTPRYNRAAFRDHPQALEQVDSAEPFVRVERHGSVLTIEYRHVPSSARRHTILRYLNELVLPVADRLGVDDIMEWLRPYIVMRLLGVYDITSLEAPDAAISLAILAQTMHPSTELANILSVGQPSSEGER